jgi:protein-S-isoprenylcysteine O-methyltransferase Ste14
MSQLPDKKTENVAFYYIAVVVLFALLMLFSIQYSMVFNLMLIAAGFFFGLLIGFLFGARIYHLISLDDI